MLTELTLRRFNGWLFRGINKKDPKNLLEVEEFCNDFFWSLDFIFTQGAIIQFFDAHGYIILSEINELAMEDVRWGCTINWEYDSGYIFLSRDEALLNSVHLADALFNAEKI